MKRKYTSTSPRILEYLAKQQASKWELSKNLNKSYANIHSNIKKALEQGHIMVSKIKPSEKNPRMQVEYYRLTFRGLIFALGTINNINDLEIVAKRYKNELLIFQEWESLKSHGAIDEVMENLKSLQDTSGPHCPFAVNTLTMLAARSSIQIEKIKTFVTNGLLGLANPVVLEGQKGIVEAIKNNPVLKNYVMSKFREDIEKDRKMLEYDERVLTMFS